MTAMSMMQLLRRSGGEGSVDLDLVDNPDNQRPTSFERPGQIAVARVGTDDLLLLADVMAERGYMATWLDLRDHRFNELDAEDDEILTGHLLGLLRRRDLDGALGFMAVQGRGLLVIGIELSSPEGIRVRINRDGIVTINHPFQGLKDDLTSGWRRVITA
jgi:hypothetical protein